MTVIRGWAHTPHHAGVAITSAMYTSPTATISATGTSMACPHVSGVVAQYLQRHPTALPAEVEPPNRPLTAEGVCDNTASETLRRKIKQWSHVLQGLNMDI